MALADRQLNLPDCLLLSETYSLLHRNGELPGEIFIRLVVWKIQSVEAAGQLVTTRQARLVNLSIILTMYGTSAKLYQNPISQ